jgi:hypothetical protein
MKDLGRTIVPAAILTALFGGAVPILVHWRWPSGAPVIEVIEAEGFLLGVLCLVFALRQYRDAKDHTASLQENTSILTEAKSTLQENTATLAEVREHISTKFLATFPSNIPELTQFISGIPHEFDIMVDFAGYGQYSVPDQFAGYFAALEECARHANIRMLVYGPGIAKLAIKQQWPESAFEEELKASRLIRFMDSHQDLIRPLSSEQFRQRLTYDKFIEFQLQVQMQSKDQLERIKNINIRTIDDAEFVLIAWIRDDEHAIFSFKNRGTTLRELAFSTRDTALLHVFRGMFKRLWDANEPKGEQVKAASGVQ